MNTVLVRTSNIQQYIVGRCIPLISVLEYAEAMLYTAIEYERRGKMVWQVLPPVKVELHYRDLYA